MADGPFVLPAAVLIEAHRKPHPSTDRMMHALNGIRPWRAQRETMTAHVRPYRSRLMKKTVPALGVVALALLVSATSAPPPVDAAPMDAAVTANVAPSAA